MAALARRSWQAILAECIRLHGGTAYPNFDERMSYWIAESYLHLSLGWHHFELDSVDSSKVLSTSTNELTLPTDCFYLIAVKLRDPSAQRHLGGLSTYDAGSLLVDYNPLVAGVPKRFSRYGSKIFFDVLPDQAYPSDLYYYKKPANPDFAGLDVPLLSEDCDLHIIEQAMELAHGGTARPDLADPYRQRLDRWLADQARSSVIEQQIPQQREKWNTNKTLGGAQG